MIMALITGIAIIIYGLYLMLFKEAVSNKDIILFLFLGFAYIGYMIPAYFEKYHHY